MMDRGRFDRAPAGQYDHGPRATALAVGQAVTGDVPAAQPDRIAQSHMHRFVGLTRNLDLDDARAGFHVGDQLQPRRLPKESRSPDRTEIDVAMRIDSAARVEGAGRPELVWKLDMRGLGVDPRARHRIRFTPAGLDRRVRESLDIPVFGSLRSGLHERGKGNKLSVHAIGGHKLVLVPADFDQSIRLGLARSDERPVLRKGKLPRPLHALGPVVRHFQLLPKRLRTPLRHPLRTARIRRPTQPPARRRP